MVVRDRSRLLLELAGAAAVAVVSAAAAWRVVERRNTERLRRLHRMMVELLLNALTSGDPITARHSRRVADLTDVLARDLLNPSGHARLRVAALLHDMGKIEDELFPLIHSARPLSDEERGEIQHHPCESASILQPLEKIHPGITEIVSAHHECWNGKGYPRRLEGDEIPIEARMISVSDVFDALTQPRPYHEPLSVEEGLEQIRRGAGSRFDPEIVALLDSPAVLNRWLAIFQRGRREEERAREKGEGGWGVSVDTSR